MVKPVYRFFNHRYYLKYHGVYRHAKKLFVFDMALLGLAIFLFAGSIFFFLWRPGITEYIDLSINLGQKRILSGQEVKLSIAYGNRSKYLLKSAALNVRLPAGFIVDRSRTPETLLPANYVIELGELRPRTGGMLEIFGRYWTSPNVDEKITAFLNYYISGEKRAEMKMTHLIANLPKSVLKGELTMSTTSLANTNMPFTYTLTNTGAAPVNEILLSYSWQNNAPVSSSIIALGPFETKTITGTVIISSGANNINVAITASVKINGRLIRQGTASRNVTIYKPNVECSFRFASGTLYAEPGGSINSIVHTKNKGTVALRNLNLTVVAKPDGLINYPLSSRLSRAKPADNEILFDRAVRTAFSKLGAGKEDAFALELKTQTRFSLDKKENVFLKIEPLLRAEVEGVTEQVFSLPCADDSTPVATEVSLASEARYFSDEGDQLGRGPLPPHLRRTTKYWISIQINNTTNELEKISFSTALAPGVQFTDKQSVTIGPEIKFDSGSRRLSWNHSEIPPHSQTGLYFEVSVTPSPDQLGKELQITGPQNLIATDGFSGKQFSITRAGLTNALPTRDEGAALGARVTE